jgi:energy-converting hydrogenase Eha subunit A
MPSDLDPTELWVTIVALLLGAALALGAAWAERRPRKALETSLIPTTPILFLGVLIGLLATVHLLNLWGITTGRR